MTGPNTGMETYPHKEHVIGETNIASTGKDDMDASAEDKGKKLIGAEGESVIKDSSHQEKILEEICINNESPEETDDEIDDDEETNKFVSL